MLRIGLTGNYGMGKSIVLSMFEKLGALTLDSDKIVASLLSERKVLEKIRKLLGNDVFDSNGILDKKKVAELIFKNDILKDSLEDILHPLVFGRIDSFLNTTKDKDKVVVIEMPLLYERGHERRFDKIITVFAEEDTALNRLEKNAISREDVIQRLKSQLPIDEKIKRSDFVINNNSTLEETMAQVKTTYKKLLQEADFGNN